MTEAKRIEALEQRVRELEAELARKTHMFQMIFDHNPEGVLFADAQGNITLNDPARAILRGDNTEAHEEWSTRYGFFREDMVTPYRPEDTPLMRTVRTGEVILEETMFAVSPGRPEGAFMTASVRPLPDGGAIMIARDITDKRKLTQELAARNADLARREEENRELIERLRVAIDELSTPVLEVWDDILTLPVVGVVDTQRSAQMTERLLNEVVRSRARYVIVDLTGVELIDTSTADRFLRLARAVQLLGARCIVTGIQPAVSQTLVELGVEFGSLETQRNLKNALEACIRRDGSGSASR